MSDLGTIHRVVILADEIVGHCLGLHGGEEGQEEHEADGDDDHDEAGPADGLLEVTVLPDDVGGLGCLSDLALVSTDCDLAFSSDIGEDVVGLLGFDADEGALGGDDIACTGQVVADPLGQGAVELVELAPLLVLDVVTTLAEAVDEP